MAEIDAAQIAQITQQVKSMIQAESQGVGEIGIVTTLDGVVSIPALMEGNVVVEVPLELFYLEAEEAIKKVDEAIKKAEETALHPTYVGEDNYVYKWNDKTQAYDKTDIYVRGEAFKISRVYTSVLNMEGDTNHGLREGDFVLINTGNVEDPDNAKIYTVDGSGKFQFVVDMSGAIGFTGKTPQLSIGTVIVGDNRADASVSLSGNGTDEDGNPRYLLNFRVPTLHMSDLSEEEIALLQSPANEMIEKLEQTDREATANEQSRVLAEKERESLEQERKAAEAQRKAEESQRVATEAQRSYAEEVREENELQRQENENTRMAAEDVRLSNEQERIKEEETRKEDERQRVLAEQERSDAETIRLQAEELRVQAEDARVQEFATLKAESEAATDDAQDTADHPTYIGTDNYVYQWDKAARTYNKTAIYVRGEAFSIKKVYASIDEMLSDNVSTFKEGDFCLINTGDVENPDNAKLYVRTSVGSWDFLVDMSGAIGFTGKVPQLFVGTVTAGSGKGDVAVTLSPAGTDSDGNPKYNLNYVVPCLAYEDLTPEQIAELQRPANDMIATLQATDNQIKANEESRVWAEDARVEEFDRLKSESETATANAITATTEANTARDAANEATEAARVSTDKANTATENADEATAKANEATVKANEATAKASTATAEANTARDAANEAAEAARMSTDKANTATANADEATAKANTATDNAKTATTNANKATENATEATEAARTATAEANGARDAANDAAEKAFQATNNANTAADEARNTPKIQNGTWWVYDIAAAEYVDTGSSATSRSPKIIDGVWWTWDDATGDYVSTGWAVNTDYELTKEKIESVFTGDIATHTHTHLIYYAQVYDGTPDFSQLTTWTGQDGMEHAFVPGNDIYVADTDEPTGYANYKLAATTAGTAWVRVPQVPEGYRMVLVRKA